MARTSNAMMVLARLWSWFEDNNNEPFNGKQAANAMNVSTATMHGYLHGKHNTYFMQNHEGKWVAKSEENPYEILENEFLPNEDREGIRKAIENADLTYLLGIRDAYRANDEFFRKLDYYLTRQIKQLVK